MSIFCDHPGCKCRFNLIDCAIPGTGTTDGSAVQLERLCITHATENGYCIECGRYLNAEGGCGSYVWQDRPICDDCEMRMNTNVHVRKEIEHALSAAGDVYLEFEFL